MSNIRVDVDYTIKDGTEIKFRSPVDCSQITGLIVYYPGADGNTVSKVFALSDAHGNNVGDIDHLFAEDVVVKVILDVTKGMAFVQNADTNAYLEAQLASKAPAGFGLGRSQLVKFSELDNLITTGWYHISDATGIEGIAYPYHFVHVVAYADGILHCIQTLYPVAEHTVLSRRKIGGTWGEWVNETPRMLLGVEYRTKERYNDKPVYTKLVYCGTVVDGEMSVVYHEGVVYPIRFDGTLGTNYSLPILAQNDANRSCTLRVVRNNIIITKGSALTNSGKGYVQVWYTKAEDGEKYLAITTQPADVTASNGDTVYYSVVAEGEGLTYQWQFCKTGWENTTMEGATTDTLTVGATTARNGYQYRCIITDNYGNSMISDAATLTVQ